MALKTGETGEPEEMDWLEAEASRGTLRNELRRLKRRAKRRKGQVIGLAIMAALLVVFKVSKKVPFYTASIVMRATEGVLVDEESPLAGHGLANYLYSVALSTERLLPLIEEYDLYPERETFGDLYAVDEFRDFLDIEIGSNFFARARDEGDAQRSVAITIHYSDFDPQLAFDIVQNLSKILIQAEADRRKMHAKRLSSVAASSFKLIDDRLITQSQALARADLALEKAKHNPRSRLLLASARLTQDRLEEDIKQTTQLMEAASADRDYINMAEAAEGANQALRFEIVDVIKPIVAPKTSILVYTMIGLFVFLCVLPISAIGLAALDNKLHHIDDVLRLGMPVVGHIPAFPGSQMGTLAERSRTNKPAS